MILLKVPYCRPDAQFTSDIDNEAFSVERCRRVIEYLQKLDSGIQHFMRLHVFQSGHVLVWVQLSKDTNEVFRDALGISDPETWTIRGLVRCSRSHDDNPWLAEESWETLMKKGRES